MADREDGAVRAVFFGSGEFGVAILDALRSIAGIVLVGVVTTPPRPAGRGRHETPTPVAARAAAVGLPLLQPARLREPAALTGLAALAPDLAVLADYGRIVPPAVLALPRRGFLNVHPSLLPNHRGATPIAGAILAGDAEAGVTLFEMNAGVDTGPIVAQEGWPLDGTETADLLEATAARRAASLLRTALPGWLAGMTPAVAQDEAAASLTRPFRREDGRLDPALPAIDLERRVRALRPWPGTFLETPDLRVAVLRAAVAGSEPEDELARLVADGDGLALTTSSDRLRLLEVRPAGGRAMTGAELRRGRPGLVGSVVVAATAAAGPASPAGRGG